MKLQRTATMTISFQQSGRPQERPRTSPGRTPRVTRLLILSPERTLRAIVAEPVWERQLAMRERPVNRDANGGEINR